MAQRQTLRRDGSRELARPQDAVHIERLVRFPAPSNEVIDRRVAAQVPAHTRPLFASVDTTLTTIWCKFHSMIEMPPLPETAIAAQHG